MRVLNIWEKESKMRKSLILLFVAFIAAGSLAFMGCGNSDDDGGGETNLNWPDEYLGTWKPNNGGENMVLTNDGRGYLRVSPWGSYGITTGSNTATNSYTFFNASTGSTKYTATITLVNENTLRISEGLDHVTPGDYTRQ
jgi:hypothetical protein